MIILILVGLITSSKAVVELSPDAVGILSAHNAGYFLKLTQSAYLRSANANLNFVIKMPRIRGLMTSPVDCASYRDAASRRRCDYARPIIDSLHRIHTSVVNQTMFQLREIENAIDAFEHTVGPRTARSFLPFIGDLIEHVTGNPSEESFHSLKETVRKLSATQEAAIQLWKSSRSGTNALIQTQNRRLDLLHNITQDQARSITTLREMFINSTADTTLSQIALSAALEKLTSYIEHQLIVSEFRTAVNELLGGKLNQHLITNPQLEQALLKLEEHLRNDSSNEEFILRRDENYYYSQGQITVTRRPINFQNNLIVTLMVPTGPCQDAVKVYEVIRSPLPVPGNENQHAVLRADITHIAYSPNCAYMAEFSEPPKIRQGLFIDVTDHKTKISRTTEPANCSTCATALLHGYINQVKEFCKYDIVTSPMPKQIMRYEIDKIFVSQYQFIDLNCTTPPRQIRKELNDTPIILVVPCDCWVIAEKTILPPTTHACIPVELNPTIHHPLNALFINEFFSDHGLNLLGPQYTALTKTELQVPPLAIQTANYSLNLARAEAMRFDFQTAVNASRDNEKLYENYWHYLSENAATETLPSDFFENPWSIFIFAGAIAGYIATGLTLLIFLRYWQLRPVLLAARVESAPTIPAVLAYVVPSSSTTTAESSVTMTPPPVKVIIDIFQQYVPVEALTILLIILVIALILVIIRRKVMSIDSTLIYLELGNPTSYQRVLLTTIRHFPGNYALQIATTPTNYLPTYFTNCFTLYLKFWPIDSRIQLTHQTLNFSITLPTQVKIRNPLTVRKIKHIMHSQSFYAALLITTPNPRSLQLRETYHRSYVQQMPNSPTNTTQSQSMQALLSHTSQRNN